MSAKWTKGKCVKWRADKRARRVPTFVIEQTKGLATKKKIVQRYGLNATFVLGARPPAKLKATA